MSSRDKFEQAIKARFGDLIDYRTCKNSDGEYMAWDMQVAWWAWQAAETDMAVQLANAESKCAALATELEASGKLIDTLRQDKDKVIDMSIERVNKLLSRAEAAEKCIAELEARTVTLPQYRNSPDMHTKQFYEAIGFNQGLDIFIEALRDAGIGVKGE